MSLNDVHVEVPQQLSAFEYTIATEMELLVTGKNTKQGDQRQRVVEITQGIGEFRVPLSNEMGKIVFRFAVFHEAHLTSHAFGSGVFVLPEPNLLLTESVDKGVCRKKVDVFSVIVGLVELLELLRWLSGVYSFQNTQSAEVFERQLQLPNRLGPCNVFSYEPSLACF
jgi:hypothetical protein